MKPKSKSRLPQKSPGKQKQPSQKGFQNSRMADLIGLIMIIILGVIIYSNSFENSFHLDDIRSIVENKYIRNLSDAGAIWNFSTTRFIPYYSFALNYHYGELHVWGYHLVNLLIHLVNACLVYWLTLLIFSSPAMKDREISKDKKMIALFTALLFVSHPLATQSVTYIVQRLSSMVAMFYLFSLVCYVQARLKENTHISKYILFAGAFISTGLAMITKENAFTIPFAILLIEICFLQKKTLSINFKDYRIILLMAAFLGLILIVPLNYSSPFFKPIPPELGNTYTVTPLNYLNTQFSVIVKYIQLLILPVNQNLDYDFPIANSLFNLRTMLSLLFLLALAVLAVFLFKKNRILSFGIIWFFLTLAIESSIIPLSDLIFEHRTYLPSFGFFLILSSGLFMMLRKKYGTIALIILSGIIVINSYLTFQRNKVWKDDLSLWNDVIKKSPGKARPFGTRGDYYRSLEQWNEALADYTAALGNNPEYTIAYHNRGGIYGKLGQWDKAIEDFTNAIEIDPNYRLALYNRANAYTKIGQWEKALEDYSAAIRIDPKFLEALYGRSLAYGKSKQWENAIEDCTMAIEIDPGYFPAWFNRGFAYYNLGQLDKAIADYTKAIELDPKNASVYYNKGVAHGALSQWNKAIDEYTKALEIDPNLTNARTNRDMAYESLGKRKQ